MNAAKIAMGFLLALAALTPTLALAQPTGPQERQERIGPYEISVMGNPSHLSVGHVRLVVTVLDAVTGQPVPDARVTLRMHHEEEGTEGWATALNSPRAPQWYEATVNLDAPGVWRVRAEVDSSLGRVAMEAPPVHVPEPRGGYTAGSFVFVGVFLALILGAVYVWWSARRIQRKQGTEARPA